MVRLGELAAEAGGETDFRSFLEGGDFFLKPLGIAGGDFLFFNFILIQFFFKQAFFSFLLLQVEQSPHL